MTKNTNFAYALHRYFTDYLQNVRKSSQNTTSAYSYTFSLLLKFLQEQKRINPQKAELSQFDRVLILDFLEWLEKDRKGHFDDTNIYLFVNPSDRKLTRSGVAYILQKYCDLARDNDLKLIPDTFSPHCLRHSKAMHLLQSGVNLIYIRDFLGHADIATTEVYFGHRV